MYKIANSFGLASSTQLLRLIDENSSYKPMQPWFVIGDASNCIIDSKLQAQCIKANFNSIEVISEDKNHVTCKVGANINWHYFVMLCSRNNWHGLENLALIPGTVGAAPIQNIGAYGVEIANRITHIETIDLKTSFKHLLSNNECNFKYRDSIFKKQLKQHLITHVHLILDKKFHQINNYQGISITKNHRNMLSQIIRIRRSKLPNPKLIGNCGSFFKNPIIDQNLANKINTPKFPINKEQTKISAAYLIESAGLKGISIGGAAISNKHALVLTNQNNATFNDVKNLTQHIQNKVFDMYDIMLEPEVTFIDQASLQLQLEQMA